MGISVLSILEIVQSFVYGAANGVSSIFKRRVDKDKDDVSATLDAADSFDFDEDDGFDELAFKKEGDEIEEDVRTMDSGCASN